MLFRSARRHPAAGNIAQHVSEHPAESDEQQHHQGGEGGLRELAEQVGIELFQHRAGVALELGVQPRHVGRSARGLRPHGERSSEEHTSELQSLMRISYAVFCLKTKTVLGEPEEDNRGQETTNNSYTTNY